MSASVWKDIRTQTWGSDLMILSNPDHFPKTPSSKAPLNEVSTLSIFSDGNNFQHRKPVGTQTISEP